MIYTLHQRFKLGESGHLARSMDEMEAIPESTAPWALVFPPFWLIKHGLWFAFFAYCLFGAFLAGLMLTDYWLISVVLSGLPGLYLLLEGHQLRRDRLNNMGYEVTDVVEAPDESVALARLIVTHTPDAPAPVSQAPITPPHVTQAPGPASGHGVA